MTDLQDHPVFFFQIQFIYLFFTGKLLLLQHKSCYYMYIFRLPICQSPLLLLFQKSVIVVMNLLKKKKKKRKMTCTQLWVKIKSYTLLNTFKKLNSAPSDLKPLRRTCLDLQCVCDAPQNCPTL